MIKSFLHLLSLQRSIKRCNDKYLSTMFVYYTRNKPQTYLQTYEYKLIRKEVRRRNLCK